MFTFATEKEIISIKPESVGKERFYVMALEDFTIGSFETGNGECSYGRDCPLGTYYWYKNAWAKMDAADTSKNFGTGYTNTGKIIEIWNKNGTGTGSYSGAMQDDHDMWKYIQSEYENGWYIPSRGEWAAFADYFEITSNCSTEDCEDDGNYDDIYGLFNQYWSSSQGGAYYAWIVFFYYGHMYDQKVKDNSYVRLGVTF